MNHSASTFPEFDRMMAELSDRYDAIVSQAANPDISEQACADQMEIGKVVVSMAQRKLLKMMQIALEMGEQWEERKAKLARLRNEQLRRIRDRREARIRKEAAERKAKQPAPRLSSFFHSKQLERDAFRYTRPSRQPLPTRQETPALHIVAAQQLMLTQCSTPITI